MLALVRVKRLFFAMDICVAYICCGLSWKCIVKRKWRTTTKLMQLYHVILEKEVVTTLYCYFLCQI